MCSSDLPAVARKCRQSQLMGFGGKSGKSLHARHVIELTPVEQTISRSTITDITTFITKIFVITLDECRGVDGLKCARVPRAHSRGPSIP